ncbi:hypothetical protein GCM10011487_44610 [Steroidobacter agaridevorans]|uniref:ATP-dependent DNA ligase family profile domain-containing protein n=1 Tax=Steroidobacter agaridevorans TaxID=2695856 RepID=A0A829YI05_9GAMM|nr:hypothetical protein GCM10011487_44610 [Steroidobacter agaridevorans]
MNQGRQNGMSRKHKAWKIPRGAKKSPMPGFIEPCNPKVGPIPTAEGWDYELKLDGYRLQAHVKPGQVTLYTRRGHDWTAKFPSIVSGLQTLLHHTPAVLDGELTAPDSQGRPNFSALQTAIHEDRSGALVFYAYDLLYLQQHDLRNLTLRARRAALGDLIGKGNEHIRISENLHSDGATLFDAACRMELEGIVSKRSDAPYRSGDQDSWIKTKCQKSDNFPIIAFVEKLGARPRRVASLYLGRRKAGKLLYAGKAQTGFRHEDLYFLRECLDPHIIPASPL